MAIEVMIKRAIDPGNDAKILLPHIMSLRAHAVLQPGYISGETLFNIECIEQCVVISRWTKLEHWQNWLDHPVRKELNGRIEKFLAAETSYDIYSVGLW